MKMNRGQKTKSIAIYGGAFDPPHIGHTAFCAELCRQDEYHEIWVLPSFTHPFDKQLTDFDLRMEMCRIAFSTLSEKVIISREETRVPGKGYTLDLLRHLKMSFPDYKFTLTLGTDNYQSRHKWKGFDEINQLVEVKFYGRKGNERENSALKVEAPFPEVSSTQLRVLLREGGKAEHLLPPGIMEFIEANRLYRNN
jgi:nicotinate-nucleotide adenylyltransferase